MTRRGRKCVQSLKPRWRPPFFLEREAADAMISEVRKDEPALAEDLRVEAIELGLG
jgi:hypothetical protein